MLKLNGSYTEYALISYILLIVVSIFVSLRSLCSFPRCSLWLIFFKSKESEKSKDLKKLKKSESNENRTREISNSLRPK